MENSNNLLRLVQALSGTLEADSAVRRQAENVLCEMQTISGFCSMLINLIVIGETPPQIALAAAITLKNFVKGNWINLKGHLKTDGFFRSKIMLIDEFASLICSLLQSKEKCEVEISEDERMQIRAQLLDFMFKAPANIRLQLSEIVCVMSKYDFPDCWPELLNLLKEILTMNDANRLLAALTTMDELFKRYRHEMKSEKLWNEIYIVLKELAPPLTVLFTNVLQYVSTESVEKTKEKYDEMLNILHLIMEIFHSLNVQDLPEHFEDTISGWMEGLGTILKLKIDSVESAYSDDEPGTLDKLKCCVCDILTLYSQRYEEEFMPFINVVIEIVWEQLMGLDARVRFDAFFTSALTFLSAICVKQRYANIFQMDGVLTSITENIILKNLVTRPTDLEQFEDEPLEYIKKDLEGSDLGSRRRATTDFLRSLFRAFENLLTPIMSNCIINLLKECSNDLQQNWLKKDLVYCLILAVGAKTETVKFGATTLSNFVDIPNFYATNVRSDLFNENVNAFPFLRCDALKFVMLFRNHLPIEELIQVISAILATLSSSHIILHQYAAVALERILLVRLKNTDKLLFNCDNVVVGPLISSLFNCFSIYPKAQNSHYLMKAVMRCFNIIDNESAKHSNEIIDRMTNMIATAVKTPVDPLHIHYVFESLCILIRRAYLIVDGGIDKYVIPLIENILANDVIEFTPYSLQLTAVLLDEAYEQKKKTGTSLIDSYLPFFNYLMKEDLWNRTANIPAALLVIESFLQCSSENILANHSSMIQAIYQKLMGSKAQDHFGFQLAISLVPKVAQNMPITHSSLIIPMLRRVQYSKTTKFSKELILFFAEYSILCGGTALFQVLESIQSGMFKMVIEKVITVELNEMSRILRFEEKRICCIGLINLTVETADYLGEYYAVMVEGLVKIAETSVYDASGIEDQCDEHELIEAYNDRYCKLVYAQHKFTLAVEIQNFKAHLAKAIASRETSHPGSVDYIKQEIRDILVRYASNS